MNGAGALCYAFALMLGWWGASIALDHPVWGSLLITASLLLCAVAMGTVLDDEHGAQ